MHKYRRTHLRKFICTYLNTCTHTYRLMSVIWTTTPWTLPANRAVAYNASNTYTLIHARLPDALCMHAWVYVITGKETLQHVGKHFAEYTVVKEMKGEELQGLVAKHPIYEGMYVAFAWS